MTAIVWAGCGQWCGHALAMIKHRRTVSSVKVVTTVSSVAVISGQAETSTELTGRGTA